MPEEPLEIQIRWPRDGDQHVPFEAGGGLSGRIDWVEFLRGHRPELASLVFIADYESDVAGAANAIVEPDTVEIAFLMRNQAWHAIRGVQVGSTLVKAIIDFAWSLRMPWVTLESLDEPYLIAFYEKEGFVKAGPPLSSADWGVLHPMRRPVCPSK